ncbi:MAG: hypothetical protein ACRD3E_17805 [Terriglobales bacterium]
MPVIYSDESGLTCAYVIGATHRDAGSTAVLHFDIVMYYAFGYPNDEALGSHALYPHGLAHYDFHSVMNSPLIAELDRRNEVHPRHIAGAYRERFRHWVITFHDETLEVIARDAHVARVTPLQPGAGILEERSCDRRTKGANLR